MIIDIDNFYNTSFSPDKNSTILFIKSETPETEVSWFQNLGIQTSMKRIVFEKYFLFLKFIQESSFFKIILKLFMNRENFHLFKI